MEPGPKWTFAARMSAFGPYSGPQLNSYLIHQQPTKKTVAPSRKPFFFLAPSQPGLTVARQGAWPFALGSHSAMPRGWDVADGKVLSVSHFGGTLTPTNVAPDRATR